MAKTILVVEDNELNMKLFKDLLEAKGYQVVHTGDGENAEAMAVEHKPDLILMDIQLPNVSGLDVIRWLKDNTETVSIPIIAVTAFAMRGDEELIRSSGCEAYISKPINIKSFLQTVAEHAGTP